MELPRLQELYDRYRDRGFEVVAVEARRETAAARRFAAEHDLTYTLLENGAGDGEVVASVFRVESVPTTFVVNRAGRVVGSHVGFEPGDERRLAEEIEGLL